ncbi:MerR family DNA-binding protein [Nocardia sp. NPDC051321]|uniref:MerR family DNA-binding protein n=1 Tax=Nocardia sp. NPDC051321 TaxID=3364323 RepID=UPI0037AD7896
MGVCEVVRLPRGLRVNAETLRYYEHRGLLKVPPRSLGGYRMYPTDAVSVVRFVKRTQELGFSLDEIDELLHLADSGPEDRDQVRSLTEARIGELARRILDLSRMQESLTELVSTCTLPRAPPGSSATGSSAATSS